MAKNQWVRAITQLVNPLATESSTFEIQYNILFVMVFVRFPSSTSYHLFLLPHHQKNRLGGMFSDLYVADIVLAVGMADSQLILPESR